MTIVWESFVPLADVTARGNFQKTSRGHKQWAIPRESTNGALGNFENFKCVVAESVNTMVKSLSSIPIVQGPD